MGCGLIVSVIIDESSAEAGAEDVNSNASAAAFSSDKAVAGAGARASSAAAAPLTGTAVVAPPPSSAAQLCPLAGAAGTGEENPNEVEVVGAVGTGEEKPNLGDPAADAETAAAAVEIALAAPLTAGDEEADEEPADGPKPNRGDNALASSVDAEALSTGDAAAAAAAADAVSEGVCFRIAAVNCDHDIACPRGTGTDDADSATPAAGALKITLLLLLGPCSISASGTAAAVAATAALTTAGSLAKYIGSAPVASSMAANEVEVGAVTPPSVAALALAAVGFAAAAPVPADGGCAAASAFRTAAVLRQSIVFAAAMGRATFVVEGRGAPAVSSEASTSTRAFFTWWCATPTSSEGFFAVVCSVARRDAPPRAGFVSGLTNAAGSEGLLLLLYAPAAVSSTSPGGDAMLAAAAEEGSGRSALAKETESRTFASRVSTATRVEVGSEAGTGAILRRAATCLRERGFQSEAAAALFAVGSCSLLRHQPDERAEMQL